MRRSGVTRGSLYLFADKAALFEEVFDRADRSVSRRVRDAAKAATDRGEDPWSVFLAGWDAVLDTAIDGPLQRIRVVDAPAVLGWQRWQELNAQYTWRQHRSRPRPPPRAGRAGAPAGGAVGGAPDGTQQSGRAAIAGAGRPDQGPPRHRSSRGRGLLEGLRTDSGSRRSRSPVEPMTGIEPAYSAWEADVLPLNYIGTVLQRIPRPAGPSISTEPGAVRPTETRASPYRLVACCSLIVTSAPRSPRDGWASTPSTTPWCSHRASTCA